MHRWSLAVVVLTAACSSTPTGPTPPPTTTTYTLTGQISATSSGQPLAGATVDIAGHATQADASGRYTLTLPMTSGTLPFRISGVGIAVAHQGFVRAGSSRAVEMDAIAAGGFDLAFYRQLVRDGYDQPTHWQALQTFPTAPNFYLRTVDATGRTVEPEVLALVLANLQRGVALWTAGRWTATIETGPDARSVPSGWIAVDFDRNRDAYCGRANVASNPGHVTFNIDRCSCGSIKVQPATVMHELGHALGFFHVSPGLGVMRPQNPGTCFPEEPSAAEVAHAAIAFTRPNGNTDPDTDPSGVASTRTMRLP